MDESWVLTAPRRAGFTLLEMMVVISVLGVLTLFVGLEWRDDGPAEETGPAATVAAALGVIAADRFINSLGNGGVPAEADVGPPHLQQCHVR